MRVLLFDPSSGASGDMIMACLLDLGADPDAVRAAVESVGCSLEIKRDEKHHIGAARVRVQAGGKRYRTLAEARSILAGSRLSPPALDRAKRVMEILAGAEGRVHGVDREEARFHEIGALDALADIAGSCAGLESIGVEKVIVLPISVGSGTVVAAHGRLPVPAPATLEVLKSSGLLWRGARRGGAAHPHGGGDPGGVCRRGRQRVPPHPGRGSRVRFRRQGSGDPKPPPGRRRRSGGGGGSSPRPS